MAGQLLITSNSNQCLKTGSGALSRDVCFAWLVCTCREILEAELGEYSAHKGIKVVCAWDAQHRVSSPSEGAAKPSTVRWVLLASSLKQSSLSGGAAALQQKDSLGLPVISW